MGPLLLSLKAVFQAVTPQTSWALLSSLPMKQVTCLKLRAVVKLRFHPIVTRDNLFPIESFIKDPPSQKALVLMGKKKLWDYFLIKAHYNLDVCRTVLIMLASSNWWWIWFHLEFYYCGLWGKLLTSLNGRGQRRAISGLLRSCTAQGAWNLLSLLPAQAIFSKWLSLGRDIMLILLRAQRLGYKMIFACFVSFMF